MAHMTPAVFFGVTAVSFTSMARAQNDIIPPKIMVKTPGGINIADGSYTFDAVDLRVGPLQFERAYYAPQTGIPTVDDTKFGTAMTYNFNIFVLPSLVPARSGVPQHAKATVHIGARTVGSFHQDVFSGSTGAFDNDSGDAGSGVLQLVNGLYQYTDFDGNVYSFTPSAQPSIIFGVSGYTQYRQKVSNVQFADGHTWSFSYDATSNLRAVIDSRGYAIAFDYGSDGRVSAACGYNTAHHFVDATVRCGGAGNRVDYVYSNGQMTSYSDALGNVTNYSYSGGLITCIKPPGYSSCKIATAQTAGDTIQQTMADGGVWSVTWGTYSDENDENYVPEDGNRAGTVTDPAGKTSTHEFTLSSPWSFTDEDGNKTYYKYPGKTDYEATSSTYPQAYAALNAGVHLREIDLPEGNSAIFTYGPFYAPLTMTTKAKPNTGLPDKIVQYQYSCPNTTLTPTCTKPTSKTDPNGNTTNWSYTAFGSPEWEMQPAPTSGAARPLKLYSYVQKSAYILNSSNQLVSTNSPIWLPSSATECQTAAGSSTPTCDSGAPQVTTTFEYGADGTADNLLLRGKVVNSGGVSYRTCYGYDQWANKIRETSPRAGLIVCP